MDRQFNTTDLNKIKGVRYQLGNFIIFYIFVPYVDNINT